MEGDYRPEHLFGLQAAVELYDAYQRKILECEANVEQHLQQFDAKPACPVIGVRGTFSG
jgi:transposase